MGFFAILDPFSVLAGLLVGVPPDLAMMVTCYIEVGGWLYQGPSIPSIRAYINRYSGF